MDIILKDMDIRPIFAGEIQRLRRAVFPVRGIGHFTRKTDWIDRSFDTLNFSFILEGEGEYEIDGKAYRVLAPCVITQWPGVPTRYGPTGASACWNEVYFTYGAELEALFEGSRLIERDYPMWEIAEGAEVSPALAEVARLTRCEPGPGWVERLDLACERTIMESRPRIAPLSDPLLRRIAEVRDEADRRFLEIESMDEVASARGLSRSAFRRLWPRVSGLPPQRYLAELKLKHACRLLVETNLTVSEVALRVGFRDPLYFSRRFRQLFQQTASAYRRRNKPQRY